jgi:hypothetical protein
MGKVARAAAVGFSPLPAPHDRVELRITTFWPIRKRALIEYRGTETDLIAAGIVTPKFFLRATGRRREDAAKRYITITRLKGRMRLAFNGNPLADPQLPGVSAEAVEAVAEEYRRELREVCREPAPEPELPPLARADFCKSMLEMVQRCASGDHPRWPDPLPKQTQSRIDRHVAVILEELGLGKAFAGAGVARPSHLRLVVDNSEVDHV